MTVAQSTHDQPSSTVTFSAALGAWRRITREELRMVFLLGCLVALFRLIVSSNEVLARPSLIYPLLAAFLTSQIGVFALLLAVAVADTATGKQAHRRAAYAVAVVVAVAVAVPLESIISILIVAPVFSSKAVLQIMFHNFFQWLVLGGAATFVYTDRRRARTAVARLRAAELARAQTAKRTLESRLKAMQARVEPQFLFHTLAQVKELYRVDPTAGECMLGELIAYLRAAMPTMRDTASTLAQEIELARAYVAIVKVRLGDCLQFSVDVQEDLGAIAMPPMMMLPLIARALAQEERASRKTLSIRATFADGRLRLTVASDSNAFDPHDRSEAITGVSERLTALFGPDAQLALEAQTSGQSAVVIEFPAESEALA